MSGNDPFDWGCKPSPEMVERWMKEAADRGIDLYGKSLKDCARRFCNCEPIGPFPYIPGESTGR